MADDVLEGARELSKAIGDQFGQDILEEAIDATIDVAEFGKDLVVEGADLVVDVAEGVVETFEDGLEEVKEVAGEAGEVIATFFDNIFG